MGRGMRSGVAEELYRWLATGVTVLYRGVPLSVQIGAPRELDR